METAAALSEGYACIFSPCGNAARLRRRAPAASRAAACTCFAPWAQKTGRGGGAPRAVVRRDARSAPGGRGICSARICDGSTPPSPRAAHDRRRAAGVRARRASRSNCDVRRRRRGRRARRRRDGGARGGQRHRAMIGALSTLLLRGRGAGGGGRGGAELRSTLAVAVTVEGVDGVLCSGMSRGARDLQLAAPRARDGRGAREGRCGLPPAEGARPPPRRRRRRRRRTRRRARGRRAPADDAAPPSGPRLSCSWRLERTLSLVEQRSRPLAVRCLRARRARRSTCGTRGGARRCTTHGTDNPRQGASWRWSARRRRSRRTSRATCASRAARNEYVTGMNAQRMLLSAQAVQRDLAALVATLHAAVKAEQATRARTRS